MENRTPDLRVANATLYQLSYDPDREAMCKTSGALQQGQSYFFSLKTRPAPLAEIAWRLTVRFPQLATNTAPSRQH